MYHITKKTFKEHSDVHTYGHGYGAVRVLYFDRQSGYSKESGSFAGSKYAIAAQGITKAALINLAYNRIVLNEVVSHNAWLGHRVAITDAQRFKVSLSLQSELFKYDQSDYEKTSYLEMHNKRKEREAIHANAKDDLPF